jgi:hypothetical protein
MISRRSLLAAATTGLATNIGRATAAACDWSNEFALPANQLQKIDVNKAWDFHFDEREVISRPLLSELKQDKKRWTEMSHKLDEIYARLAHRSRHDCDDKLGLLYQVWWHESYCRNGPENVHMTWK